MDEDGDVFQARGSQVSRGCIAWHQPCSKKKRLPPTKTWLYDLLFSPPLSSFFLSRFPSTPPISAHPVRRCAARLHLVWLVDSRQQTEEQDQDKKDPCSACPMTDVLSVSPKTLGGCHRAGRSLCRLDRGRRLGFLADMHASHENLHHGPCKCTVCAYVCR